MGTKTISLRDEAYQRLRQARLRPGESFSDVVLRAVWPDAPLTAGEYLDRVRERGPLYTATQLDQVEAVKSADSPPRDKWRTD
ncbi:MAG: antitoxin VapB family protein [Gemmatimonadales bacterium]|nr:antitoxin VapB family protein [Gemmatimonadales bacterium]